MLTLFRNAGWRVEVRDAGTFDYHDMLLVNFDGGKSVDHLEHVPLGHLDRRFEVSEREVKMFSRFREAVIAAPAQGTFWLTGIDSTHYPYKWGRDWKPPIAGFVENPIFTPLPSEEEIESVRKRYWNSVAWDDHLFGDFITFLRSTGRYDDAIIVVTGDHGEEFKEHGSWFHCSGVNREQTNVPLLIKWPASWGRGPALADASHLDIAPTLLDAAGFPREIWSRLPGRSLRDAKAATSIVATNYSGESREAMLWRRDGYEAAFSWESPWLEQVPGRIWLQRLEGPAGQIRCETPEGYEAKLRELFPDAFARIASSFTPAASDVTKVASDRPH